MLTRVHTSTNQQPTIHPNNKPTTNQPTENNQPYNQQISGNGKPTNKPTTKKTVNKQTNQQSQVKIEPPLAISLTSCTLRAAYMLMHHNNNTSNTDTEVLASVLTVILLLALETWCNKVFTLSLKYGPSTFFHHGSHWAPQLTSSI